MSKLNQTNQDSTKELIEGAVAFLNKKYLRQGSNQVISEAVFDDTFKKHKDHLTILAKHPRELSDDEKKYVDEFHQRLAADRRAQNPEKFAEYDKREAKRKAELKANPFKSGLPKPAEPEDKNDGPWDAARAARITRNTGP